MLKDYKQVYSYKVISQKDLYSKLLVFLVMGKRGQGSLSVSFPASSLVKLLLAVVAVIFFFALMWKKLGGL